MELTESYWIYALGFFAQALFGTRQVVQLYHAEKKGRVVSPTIFWQLSLLASFLFLMYGIIRNDIVIVFGQTLSYFIYIRNLQLKNSWRQIPFAARVVLTLLPFLAIAWTIGRDNDALALFTNSDMSDPVVLLGGVGQLMLNFRYLYQWYHSERQRMSILPLGFWIISIVASLFIVRYAVYVTPTKTFDPVLLVAQSLGMLVYIRNIMIHYKSRTVAVSR